MVVRNSTLINIDSPVFMVRGADRGGGGGGGGGGRGRGGGGGGAEKARAPPSL